MIAQDLRLGNWVLHNGKPRMISSGNAVELYKCISEVAGVDLSPSILEKAGFVKCEGDDLVWYEYREHPKKWFGGSFDIINFGDDEFIFSHNRIRVPVPSVHILQNIFFLLTSTELTIDLK